MRTILEIYFGINLFLSGYSFADMEYADSKKEIKKAVLVASIFLLFGVFIILGSIFWAQLLWLWSEIQSKTQVAFFFHFYFTEKYDKIDPEKLHVLSMVAKNVKNTGSWSHRLYRKCVKMVNKRNNYTFTEQ